MSQSQSLSPSLSLPRSEQAELLEAMELQHRAEINKLAMKVALYRRLLEEHGIEPPDASGEDLLDMWRRCMGIVAHTHDFVHRLGSSKELLEQW